MTPSQTPTLTLERTFDATQKELWDAWTDPEQYAQWLNPAPGMDLVIHEFDVRPGGKVRFDMPQPDGSPNPQDGVFHTLDPYDRLVSGAPDKSFLLDVTFEPVGERTRMRVVATGVPPEYHEMATVGWNAGFDKLAGLVGKHRGSLVMTRILDAPPQAVWAAWTTPDGMKQWWGPEGFTAPHSQIDLRVGGKYLHGMRDPDGKDYWSTGVYKEIRPFERLVMSDNFADAEGNIVSPTEYGMPEVSGEAQITVLLEDLAGKTRMTLLHTVGFDHEMKKMATMGWSGSFDKLATTLEKRVEA